MGRGAGEGAACQPLLPSAPVLFSLVFPSPGPPHLPLPASAASASSHLQAQAEAKREHEGAVQLLEVGPGEGGGASKLHPWTMLGYLGRGLEEGSWIAPRPGEGPVHKQGAPLAQCQGLP